MGVEMHVGAGIDIQDVTLIERPIEVMLAVASGRARDEVHEGGAITALVENELAQPAHGVALRHVGNDVAKQPLANPARNHGRLPHVRHFFRRLHHAQAHDQIAGVFELRLWQRLHDSEVVADEE